MASSTLKIDGLTGTVEALKQLGRKASGSIVRKGLRTGGNVVRDRMRSEAPSLTGKLRRAISVKSAKRKRGKLAVSVGPRAAKFPPKKFYPAFVIRGYRVRGGPHKVAPNDFVTRSFQTASSAAAEAVTQRILAEIELR